MGGDQDIIAFFGPPPEEVPTPSKEPDQYPTPTPAQETETPLPPPDWPPTQTLDPYP